MPGILKIAYKPLINDRAKFAALLVGITFSVFLMIEMTSMFSGTLNRASATVINIGASIWPDALTLRSPLVLAGVEGSICGHQVRRAAKELD